MSKIKSLVEINGAPLSVRLNEIRAEAETAHAQNLANMRRDVEARIAQLVTFRITQAIDAMLQTK